MLKGVLATIVIYKTSVSLTLLQHVEPFEDLMLCYTSNRVSQHFLAMYPELKMIFPPSATSNQKQKRKKTVRDEKEPP